MSTTATPAGPAGPNCDRSPDLPGPYAAGVTTVVLERQTEAGPRLLVTEVWYPATPAKDAPLDRYDADDLLSAEARTKIALPAEAAELEQPAREGGRPEDVALLEGGALAQVEHGVGRAATHQRCDLAGQDHERSPWFDLCCQGAYHTLPALRVTIG